MKKLTLEGILEVPDADLKAVLAELPKHIELTRREPGCLVFEVRQDADRHNSFHVFEAFADRAAFERHQLRVQDSRWGSVSKNARRYYKVSEE